ncbi:MAG: transposase [Rhodospirillaceae bacterium]|nr:transposase [Rhodospirillaceae bacterium]
MGKNNFNDGFKRDAVAQLSERGYPVAEVSERLGISQHSLYQWKKRFGGVCSTTSKCSTTRKAQARAQRDAVAGRIRAAGKTDTTGRIEDQGLFNCYEIMGNTVYFKI